MGVRFLTVCGSGIVTSSMLAETISDWLKEEGYEGVEVNECNPSEMANFLARQHHDFVAYASPIDHDQLDGVPAVPAIGLITGMGTDEFYDNVKQILSDAGINPGK
ncbi:MAG: hypothetical protein IJI44_05610 [Erysipelotrichaceae bacterium]|nr:hypothetical protein [Erysipelotrichaceae bacterium]MBQ1342342.1 hypothetical protein [Erysipelotrichaceae bacterium]MBQ1533361.1 hypothetical protein [Erysipelotrichaceae bacterium]MBQ1567036.1 hypothetical protein [Erysipelotrichaceae bacterium]MBQ6478830.1 hypothetical protein [Erysipelotrichaceae bacterium]